jgi:heme-degrading monooxygenase HmoA
MYAVVNHLHLSIPVDQIVEGMEREAIPLLKGLPGFQGINLVKVASDRAIVILFWDSAANADNGAKTFGPTWFAKNIAPYLASEQQRSVGEVIVHG